MADHRALQGDDPLHGADHDPHVHEVGRGGPRRPRPASLRLLGRVGEPINPEAWIWYRENIGGDRTPVVDTWWQTETGAIMITPLPGVTADQARRGDAPLPGISCRRRRQAGQIRSANGRAASSSSPSRGRACCAASGATTSATRRRTGRASRAVLRRRRREEGRGRRPLAARPGRRRHEHLGSQASRRPRSSTPWCRTRRSPRQPSSARRIPRPGKAIVAFVIVRGGCPRRRGRRVRPGAAQPRRPGDRRRSPSRVRSWSCRELPKTRSGKIMRRLLRDVAEHRELGDVTTLLTRRSWGSSRPASTLPARTSPSPASLGSGLWSLFERRSNGIRDRLAWSARARSSRDPRSLGNSCLD